MPLELGLDGKARAVDINTGQTVAPTGTLYVGLLQAAPAEMDGMSLATLIAPGNGNEFTIGGSFYDSRKSITFGVATSGNGPATAVTNVTPTKTWTNNGATNVTILGFFITDAASSTTTGKVLWVGVPDAAPFLIAPTKKVTFTSGDIIVGVD